MTSQIFNFYHHDPTFTLYKSAIFQGNQFFVWKCLSAPNMIAHSHFTCFQVKQKIFITKFVGPLTTKTSVATPGGFILLKFGQNMPNI